MSTTTPVTTPVPADSGSCNMASNGSVYPDPFGMNIASVFAGVPQNLLINIIIFATLLAIFVVLRKRRWNTNSRVPLVGQMTNDWSSLFYGNRAMSIVDPQPGNSAVGSEPESPNDAMDTDASDVGMVRISQPSDNPHALSFLNWIRNALLANDELLLERSGPAALEYLRFQRHVIAFTAVLCIISVAIILPINYKGDQQAMLNLTFPRTTISNLDPSQNELWVHVAFTLILFPMAVLVMYSYGMQFGLVKVAPKKIPKTLMFNGLKTHITTEEKIRQHFLEVYPDIQVTAVNLTLNVAKLNQLDEELTYISQALAYYDKRALRNSEHPLVKNIVCGCCLGRCVQGVDAVDFYQKKKSELEKKVLNEMQSWKKTNPVFFVTFATEDMTSRVYRDYHHLAMRKKPWSSVSDAIGAKHWKARLAPSASFVSWENLSSNGVYWWARAIVINFILLIFLIFLSTPAVIMNSISAVKLEDNPLIRSLPFVSQFLPTILLLTVSGLIPVFLYYTVRWIGYHTRSKEMLAEMKLLFTFLLLAILILPSLALTSLDFVYKYIFLGESVHVNTMFKCAFLPDNGAIYVNLMITTAFVGAATRLLRFGPLFVFLCRFFCCARSDAERHILSRTKIQFPYHEYYPDFLLTFTTITVYSFVCPMIVPFGLVTLIMKYLIDRYNLSYVFGRSDAPNSVHASAVNFFLVGVLMQNVLMLAFFVVRNVATGEKAMTSLLLASLVINSVVYILISWFGLLKKVSLDDGYQEDEIETPLFSSVGTPIKQSRSGVYIPPVLQRFEAEGGRTSISPVRPEIPKSNQLPAT